MNRQPDHFPSVLRMPAVRHIACAGLGLAALLAAGCGVRPLPAVAPDWFETIRTSGWDSHVDHPEACWSPTGEEILARTAQGFVVYQEGDPSRQQTTYLSDEGRESGHPQWVNDGEVVFGPVTNATRLDDGRVAASGGGVVVVDISGSVVKRHQLSDEGYRPRVGRGVIGHKDIQPSSDPLIYVQIEDHMAAYDADGVMFDLGRGFFPEPRRDDSGAWCYQETPVSEPDWWTGKPVRSPLVVDWGGKQIELFTGASQARWTKDGGLIVTMLRAEPPASGPWTGGGTDVMWIPGRGQAPRLVAPDASEADPNPSYAVVACTTNDGHVLIVARDGSARVDLGPGHHPQWNHDGTRLLIEQDPVPDVADATDPTAPSRTRRSAGPPRQHLTVFVFRIGPQQ